MKFTVAFFLLAVAAQGQQQYEESIVEAEVEADGTWSGFISRMLSRNNGQGHFCGSDATMWPANDMGMRFNKVQFPGAVPAEARTLVPADYPICLPTARWLRQSLCWSVIQPADCRECDESLSDLVAAIGGGPTHATYGESSFWVEMREVISMRAARLADADPAAHICAVPTWEGARLEDMAELVHNEYPGKNQAGLIETFIGAGAGMNRTIVPSQNYADFLRYEVFLAEMNTWAISKVGPYNFGLKWYGGRARPEEVAWHITTEAAARGVAAVKADGIPADVVDSVVAMGLTDPHDFTAYPEGAPFHPAWPAMHSAGSVSSFWTCVVMDLTPAQRCAAQRLDWGVSYGRTIAGVHYPTDNTAGLNLGQEILARKMPKLLQKKYRSNYRTVTEKVESCRHDWNLFPQSDCYAGLI